MRKTSDYSIESTLIRDINDAIAFNVLELLNEHGVHLGYCGKGDDGSILFNECEIIPYIIRITGSEEEKYFLEPRVDFYLMTSGKSYCGVALQEDNPLIKFNDDLSEASLYSRIPPHSKIESSFILYTKRYPLFDRSDKRDIFNKISSLGGKIFLILRKQWREQEIKLLNCDMKFGFSSNGNIVLVSTINNHSWVLFDKYRNNIGGKFYYTSDKERCEELKIENYKRVQRLSGLFQEKIKSIRRRKKAHS